MKKREELDRMTKEEFKAEWRRVLSELRDIQPQYTEILKKAKIEAGQKCHYLTKEECELIDRHRKIEEQLQLISEIMNKYL